CGSVPRFRACGALSLIAISAPTPARAQTLETELQASDPPAAETAPPDEPAVEPRPSPVDPPFFKLLFKDLGHVLESPAHWNGGEWVFFFGTLGAAGELTRVDQKVYDEAKRSPSTWQQ